MKKEYENPSCLPPRMRVLSGSALKMIAVLVMLNDHIGSVLLRHYPPAQQTLLTLFGRGFSAYRICRNVGRLAFPIYCFLLVEGFIHTHSRFRYGRNLLIFALISELPWNMASGGSFRCDRQNVYFTLLLGYLAMCLAERYMHDRFLQVCALMAMLFVSVLFKADYSYRGFVLIMIMYWLRNERAAQALIGSCWLKYEWVAGFSFIFINMYNGERGFVRSKTVKYLFYMFYPLHLLILTLLRYLLFGIGVK